jgi:hypothetical protein
MQLKDLVMPKYCSRSPNGISRFRTVLPSVFEACYGPLSDDVTFQFRHGTNDCEHRAAHRRRGVEGFLVRHKVDSKGVKLVQGHHKLADTAGESVESPNHNDIEGTTAGVHHERIEPGPSFLGAAASVAVDPL